MNQVGRAMLMETLDGDAIFGTLYIHFPWEHLGALSHTRKSSDFFSFWVGAHVVPPLMIEIEGTVHTVCTPKHQRQGLIVADRKGPRCDLVVFLSTGPDEMRC